MLCIQQTLQSVTSLFEIPWCDLGISSLVPAHCESHTTCFQEAALYNAVCSIAIRFLSARALLRIVIFIDVSDELRDVDECRNPATTGEPFEGGCIGTRRRHIYALNLIEVAPKRKSHLAS